MSDPDLPFNPYLFGNSKLVSPFVVNESQKEQSGQVLSMFLHTHKKNFYLLNIVLSFVHTDHPLRQPNTLYEPGYKSSA